MSQRVNFQANLPAPIEVNGSGNHFLLNYVFPPKQNQLSLALLRGINDYSLFNFINGKVIENGDVFISLCVTIIAKNVHLSIAPS